MSDRLQRLALAFSLSAIAVLLLAAYLSNMGAL